ncbi:MAG TPA: aminoacyl-histidine dipeptidase [Candidatus Mediterraneibacter merdipullorum]|nr:aminoacyl-histidine dipeptidase [Candidatus Mediterraneibacter merdipullorum]
MEYRITGYKPEKLFHFFEEVCAVPRGSGNEKGISDFLVKFAKDRNLWVYQDDSYNVIIKKAGSKGAEDKAPVMLQGHIDMVCDKRAGVEHDFEKEGIDLVLRDGVLSANGTTLGADNGVAIALMMMVLDDEDIIHPPVECVFTTEEEVGLNGAQALDKSQITARTMINMDSEEEGVATVSCAGGLRVQLTRQAERIPAEGTLMQIKMEGLLGGHSGTDIDKERQNANILMARMLDRLLRETDGKLVTYAGGTKDNAITRECGASLIYEEKAEAEKAEKLACDMAEMFSDEISSFEPDFACEISLEDGQSADALKAEDAEALVHAVRLAPNGVHRRNIKMDGFVVVSSNIGVVRTDEKELVIVISPRSSVASLQEDTKARLALLAETFGFEISFSGEYPGWDYKEDSQIRQVFAESYRELFGTEMRFEALHAGLECGLFSDALPGLDAIAVGPTLYNVHTPDENVPLDSFERFYELLKDVLARLAGK